jgi:hypothetical protein
LISSSLAVGAALVCLTGVTLLGLALVAVVILLAFFAVAEKWQPVYTQAKIGYDRRDEVQRVLPRRSASECAALRRLLVKGPQTVTQVQQHLRACGLPETTLEMLERETRLLRHDDLGYYFVSTEFAEALAREWGIPGDRLAPGPR